MKPSEQLLKNLDAIGMLEHSLKSCGDFIQACDCFNEGGTPTQLKYNHNRKKFMVSGYGIHQGFDTLAEALEYFILMTEH